MEIVGIEQSCKIGKFKDDNKYVLRNKGDNSQDKLLKNVFGNKVKDDKHNAKVLLLTNELKENIEKVKKYKT